MVNLTQPPEPQNHPKSLGLFVKIAISLAVLALCAGAVIAFLFFHRFGYLFNGPGFLNNDQKFINDCVKVRPISICYVNLGAQYYNEANAKVAKEYYSKALQEDGNNYLAYYNIGLLYADADDSKNAIENYEKALSIEPDYEPAAINLSNRYIQTKQCQKAVDLSLKYFTHSKLDKNKKIMSAGLAEAYECLGNYNKAIEAAVSSINSLPAVPEDYLAYKQLMVVYCRDMEDYQKGINYGLEAAKLIETNPYGLESDADVYFELATCYYNSVQPDQAKKYYLKSIEIDPSIKTAAKNAAVFKYLGINN